MPAIARVGRLTCVRRSARANMSEDASGDYPRVVNDKINNKGVGTAFV